MSGEKDSSVAPKERINIKFVPATGGQQAEVELPLAVLVTGNLQGYTQETPIEDRQVVSVNKNNFESVMKESGLHLDFAVKNKLDEADDNDLAVSLNIESLDDFTPDKVARQVPELSKLLELREALVALKGPLGNIPAFRNSLQNILSSEQSRKQLLEELDLIKPTDTQ